MAHRDRVTRVRGVVSRRTVLLAVSVLNLELAACVAYFAFTDATLTSPAFTVYGLVWVTLGALVLFAYDPPAGTARARRRAGVVALAYFGVLAVASGTVGVTNPATPTGLSVSLLPPGWGPAVVYGGNGWSAALLPARVIGNAALAYLLYGRLVAASHAGWAGVLGLVSCVSCTFPVIAGAAAAVVGGTGAAASLAAGLGYGPATAVFLLTVALLWRGPETIRALRRR